jgi:hypothetical protein
MKLKWTVYTKCGDLPHTLSFKAQKEARSKHFKRRVFEIYIYDSEKKSFFLPRIMHNKTHPNGKTIPQKCEKL